MGACVKIHCFEVYYHFSHNIIKLIKHEAVPNMKQSFSVLKICTLKIRNTPTVSVMHFLVATTLVFSCSHCCFVAERKKSSFDKVSGFLNPTRVWFFWLSVAGRVDSTLLSKFFSNNATDLKLSSNVELP